MVRTTFTAAIAVLAFVFSLSIVNAVSAEIPKAPNRSLQRPVLKFRFRVIPR